MVVLNVRLLEPVETSVLSIEFETNHCGKYVKEKICEKTGHKIDSLGLIVDGKIVEDNDHFEELVHKGESTVHCMVKQDVQKPSNSPLTSQDLGQLISNLTSSFATKNCEFFIRKLRSSPRVAKEFGPICQIQDDPESLAFILDPYLLEKLLVSGDLEKVISKKPVLGKLLAKLQELLQDEAPPKKSSSATYSLDAMSDEEMDVDQGPSNSNRGEFAPITPAQLAAALAAAGTTNWRAPGPSSGDATQSGLETPASASTPFNTPGPTSAPSTAGGASPGGSLITSEMFNQALQNAIGATSNASAVTSSMSENRQSGVSESLQLMREMGITDEVMSRQALQVTNGDVQAAVNLIFAQMMADD